MHKQSNPQTVNIVNVPVLDVQSSFVDSSLKEFTVKNVVRTQTNLNQVPSNESFICTENLSDSCRFHEKKLLMAKWGSCWHPC